MKLRRGADLALLLQAALIVVPLALLSVVAIRFLQQDRAAIRLEAQMSAQPVATEVVQWAARDALPLIERILQTRPELQGIVVKGKIVWPPPFAEVPAPPAWISKLTAAQIALWRAAEKSDYAQDDARSAVEAWERVRDAASKELRLNAGYRLLQLDPKAGPERCAAFAGSAAGELADSGAPLSDLALLLGLQRLGKARMPASLLSGIEASVRRAPSFLTQSLLDAAEAATSNRDDVARVRDIKTAWRERDATLDLARAYLRRGGELPVVQWTGEGDESTLIVRLPEKERIRFARIPLPLLSERVRQGLGGAPVRIPDYATLELAVEGRSLHLSKKPLPEAQRLAFADGNESPVKFSAALYLTSEDKLFARYRQRRLLTIWLIISAAATALIGLFGLWRTSRRQSRLSEMKSNFVSSVSHELRAPIAAIRLMAENLKDGRVEGAERHDEYFRLIVLECRRLTALVENVLDFSRIDQARKKYAFEPVDVESLVGHAVAMMEPCAQERGVTLEYRGVPASVEAMQPRWDAHAVQQALVNLLDNAIKFSPKGQRVLAGVDAAGENGEAPRLGIWVEDAGEGIPAEDHGRIFERFYRRGSELRRETGGVGIGLTIVKHVAEAHGGRVDLRSAVGEGSRFSLILPIEPPGPVKR